MTADAGDAFLLYGSDGVDLKAIPIARLAICGLGRDPANLIVLDDDRASREHALIRRNAAGRCTLNDLDSTNGTFLNGQRVQAAKRLQSGDRIQIGRQTIAFVQTGQQVEPTALRFERTIIHVDNQLVSVLVTDIRGFTRLAAEMGEGAIAAMMSDINGKASELHAAAGVWSTKFVGDAIAAFWRHPTGALTRQDVATVLDVISGYQEIFRLAEKRHRPPSPLRFGCGYNAGMASVGNIGGTGAADFTALGEAVNIAFRLETATKQAGCDLLVSGAVFQALADACFWPPRMIAVELKGYDDALAALPVTFAQVGALLEDLHAAPAFA